MGSTPNFFMKASFFAFSIAIYWIIFMEHSIVAGGAVAG
jgi:hypothetical protein